MRRVGNPGKPIQQNCKLSTYVEPKVAENVTKLAAEYHMSISEYIKMLIIRELNLKVPEVN